MVSLASGLFVLFPWEEGCSALLQDEVKLRGILGGSNNVICAVWRRGSSKGQSSGFSEGCREDDIIWGCLEKEKVLDSAGLRSEEPKLIVGSR